jgi:hypothetical protein
MTAYGVEELIQGHFRKDKGVLSYKEDIERAGGYIEKAWRLDAIMSIVDACDAHIARRIDYDAGGFLWDCPKEVETHHVLLPERTRMLILPGLFCDRDDMHLLVMHGRFCEQVLGVKIEALIYYTPYVTPSVRQEADDYCVTILSSASEAQRFFKQWKGAAASNGPERPWGFRRRSGCGLSERSTCPIFRC